MATEAQRRAVNNYNKNRTMTVCLRLNKERDKDVIEALERADSKQGYIKNLIRQDISI